MYAEFSLLKYVYVPFLHGKSVTRVKSASRVVKCFSMSDPLAPRVDLEFDDDAKQTLDTYTFLG